jgi:GWxTD domain-containing protein
VRRAVLVAALLLGACGGATSSHTAAAALNNTYLSPALSQWLIGAVAHLATPEEIRGYLALREDAAATAFIESFWAARDPDPSREGNPLRQLFELREREADRRFSEAGYLGRRTDRGKIFVLYGEPKKIDFEINPHQGAPPVERWEYAADKTIGLDHHRPVPVYRFVKHDDLTVLYALPASQRGVLIEPPG